MPKTILFDFDGTIADSLRATIVVYNRIAPHYNARPIQEKHIETFKSDRIQRFFKYLNLKYYKLPFMVIKGRSEFRKDMGLVTEQPGVCDVIRQLKIEGHTLGILTSNSKENVSDMLNKYGIADCFSFLKNSKHMFGKSKYIKQVIKSEKTTADQVYFVADETRDIEAAHKAKINMVAVTWGFQNRRAFKKLSPEYIVDTPDELYSVLKS
ncbi:MAG: HAD hydrolase-like protein [Fibrobacterales bacterium]